MNKKKEEETEEVESEVVKSEEKAGTIAIVSLVLGIVSIACCIPFLNAVLAIAAVVLGIIELKNIKIGEASDKGKVLAIIGIVLGGLVIVWSIISIFFMGITSIINLLEVHQYWQ